jgi:hypothetical protein
MLAVTHLVACLVLIYVLNLDRNDAFVGLLFGFFIDVDHLFGLHGYVKANGLVSLVDFDGLMSADGHWKSLFHNPVAVMVVGPLSVASKLALPLLFWAVHVGMDYAEDTFLGVFSFPEAVLLTLMSLGLVTVRYSKHLELHPDATLWQYMAVEWRRLGAAVRGRPAPVFA